jgi:hypothetical protein
MGIVIAVLNYFKIVPKISLLKERQTIKLYDDCFLIFKLFLSIFNDLIFNFQ